MCPTAPKAWRAGEQAGQPIASAQAVSGRIAVLAIILAALLLAGCDSARVSAPASPVPSTPPIASPTPVPPVAMSVTVAQQGSLASHTLTLATMVTATNYQAQAIGIINHPGFAPSDVMFEVETAVYGTRVWSNPFVTDCSFSCPAHTDVVTLPPGRSQTWTEMLDVSKSGGFVTDLQYRVVATIQWHTGKLADDLSNVADASGAAEITFM